MPELRKDPVVGRWVIIATERAKRPSDFKVPEQKRATGSCVFCEGHEHETPPEIYALRPGASNPDTPGWDVRVVPNKYPALSTVGDPNREGLGMCDLMNGVGTHEVIIETPEHGRDLAELSQDHIAKVLMTYRRRIESLRDDGRLKPDYTYIEGDEIVDLAGALKQILTRLGVALGNPPFNYVLHHAPFRRPRGGYWTTIEEDYHWHIELMPRLTRIAGFEWGSGFYINPTPPEVAADTLRDVRL